VFKVGDHVYLKVSPMKGVNCFRVRGKLAPCYIGPFLIIKQCGLVVYRLKLPTQLSAVHNVFHVSHPKKCLRVPDQFIEIEGVELEPYLTYAEYPVRILDQKDRVTQKGRSSSIRFNGTSIYKMRLLRKLRIGRFPCLYLGC
jgi:hypothetical protein